MSDLLSHSLHTLAQMLHSKAISATELTQACLNSISANAELNAFITVCPETSLQAAQQADERRARGESAPLLGLPLALKDNLCLEGVRMTCGSRILGSYVPPYDATAVARLKAAGAILLGKTNLDEFAMGSSTENSAFGPSRNPWDRTRVPGGSSGGSAVAVAAGLAAGALGSDTGGSIRQPAALTGIVGLKPTYGRVSRYGLTAFGSSLDQIGPFGRDVASVAQLFQAIAGSDAHDATSVDAPVPDILAGASLRAGIAGLRIGIPAEYFGDGADPEVVAAIAEAKALYASLGATLVDVSLPLTDQGISVYYIVATAEASSNLSRFDGIRFGQRHMGPRKHHATLQDVYEHTRSDGFGEEVQRRIMLGTYVLSAGYYDAYYARALQARAQLRQEFQRAFERCDVLLTPTSPVPAFKLGERSEPLQMYLADVYTVSANLAGLPAISIPCGLTRATDERPPLPIGMQLLAPHFREELLFQVAHAFERETDWHLKRPPGAP